MRAMQMMVKRQACGMMSKGLHQQRDKCSRRFKIVVAMIVWSS